MKIKVNNEFIETSQKTLWGLLEQIEMQNQQGVAVALNFEVISQSDFKETFLNENDQVMIVKATQGG